MEIILEQSIENDFMLSFLQEEIKKIDGYFLTKQEAYSIYTQLREVFQDE